MQVPETHGGTVDKTIPSRAGGTRQRLPAGSSGSLRHGGMVRRRGLIGAGGLTRHRRGAQIADDAQFSGVDLHRLLLATVMVIDKRRRLSQ